MSYPPPLGPPEENNPYAQQPASPAPQYYQQPYGQYAAPTGGNNGLAIGSMVTGIVSLPLACCCSFLGVIGGGVALVLGFIGMNQIKERGQSNRGMAIAGLATGAAAVLLGIALIIATFVFNTGSYFNNFNFK
jgi:Domain of unknown function (DUF4190)